MLKYWGKQNFSPGSLPEVGQKQKTEKEKEERKLVIAMAYYALRTPPRVAHASRLGQNRAHTVNKLPWTPQVGEKQKERKKSESW